ncbi:hypothetical protein D521_0419 [beta proteobacterium CB]|nr:hypothetical protein D521_0419 [beta proteobacterium CB]
MGSLSLCIIIYMLWNEEYRIYLKKETNDHWHDTFGVGDDFY